MSQHLLQGGFSKADYLDFIDMRFGRVGQVTWWYAYGDITSYPEGNRLGLVEGCDTGRLLSLDEEKCEAHAITRKYVLFRTPAGEIMKTPEGQPVLMDHFTYQDFKMWLEDDRLHFSASTGAGPLFRENTSGPHSEKQVLGPMTVYSTPFWIDGPNMQLAECYDFMRIREKDGTVHDKGVWNGFYPLPPFLGEGRSSWHSYFQRFDRFEDLPEEFQTFTLEYAPLWKEPPKDMEEIERMKNPV